MSPWHDDPARLRPMLASLASPPIAQPGLIYEPKYDGIRALIDVQPVVRSGKHSSSGGKVLVVPGGKHSSSGGKVLVVPGGKHSSSGGKVLVVPGEKRASSGKTDPTVTIYSRNGNDKTAQFPEIAAAMTRVARALRQPVLLDGEIVAIDEAGKPLGFQHIQGRIHLTDAGDIARAARQTPAALVLFDILRDGDEDLRRRPLAERRVRLQERIRPGARDRTIRLSEIALDDGRPLFERAAREGWEGLIVKDASSVYETGRRTPAWRKMKLLTQQEFVVGGWTEPRQTRAHFGALLLGYYDEAGRLRWAGSVGTGFDQAELDRVAGLLRRLEIPASPFADAVKTAERAHWARPELVVEVRFTEWTSDGLLRQPVYLGTRADKPAKDVRREGNDERRPGRQASSGTTSVVRDDERRPGRRKDLSPVIDTLRALEREKKDGDLRLPNGDSIRVTNLAKVFWPKPGLTKGDLLRYYVEVSPYLLPVVDDRPLVMKRFPNGVTKPAFYQQRHPETPPPGVRRQVLPAEVDPIDEEGPRDRLIGGSLTTLLYMAQLAAISQDPWFSRVADLLHPDYAAIDLDPGEGTSFEKVLDVARWIKDELDALGIPGVPKTSGARGLHIYLPLPPKATYETGQLLCQIVATIVATKHPKAATIERMVKRRPRGSVYVDVLQNILGKTLACAYSARASDYAGVSTPLTWKEVEEGVDPRAFTIRTAPARFKAVGDLWATLRTGKPVDIERVLRRVK